VPPARAASQRATAPPIGAASHPTLGALARRLLRVAGVDAAYGAPGSGLDVVPAPAAVAPLLARAHGVVIGRPAATCDAGGLVRVGTGSDPVVVTGAAELAGALPALAAAAAGGPPSAVRLDLDPDAPAPAVALPSPAPPPDRWQPLDAEVVAAVTAARRPVVLAGPGVVGAGCVPGLHGLAAAAHVGVLNTWGAKGIFDWRSRHHLATAGLQARDFELGGLADADLIVATGLDGEVPDAAWRLAPAIEVPPTALSWLSERWARPAQQIPMPPLRTALAAVTQAGWEAAGTPVAPTRVTLAYSRALGAGGLVAAPGGTAGYWIARTFPTSVLGSVAVVEPDPPGLAVACAAVARRRDPARAVLAVLDALDPASAAVQEAAAALGVAVPVHVWDAAGPAVSGDELEDRLAAAVQAEAPVVERIATDSGQLVQMVDAAGRICAPGEPPYWIA
jgi:hypothetical protein